MKNVQQWEMVRINTMTVQNNQIILFNLYGVRCTCMFVYTKNNKQQRWPFFPLIRFEYEYLSVWKCWNVSENIRNIAFLTKLIKNDINNFLPCENLVHTHRQQIPT